MFNLPQRFPNLANLGKVTVPYGGQTKWEGFHPGVDIANAKGTPIPAPVSGTITNVVTGKKQGDNGYGNSVTVKDTGGNQHKLSHLDNVFVRPGDRVQAGRPTGTMGNSGSTYSQGGQGDGTHLDYRIVSAYGRYMNPMSYHKFFMKKR